MLIAQVSDMHLRRKGEFASGIVDTVTCFEHCLARIQSLSTRPDLLVFTGDLVDSGTTDEYRHLRRLLEPLSLPYYLIPGNHDNRKALREVFHDHPHLNNDKDFIQYVVSDYPLRLIFLDTLDPGHDNGMLDRPRCDWLRTQLSAAPTSPTIVFMHHPPFVTGIRGMDQINCYGSEQLAQIVHAFPCIERIFCGHLHRTIQTRWANTLACIAPSCTHQIELELRDDDTLPIAFNLEPPGFLLHLWRQDSGIITHNCVIGDYPGPYPFAE